MGIRYYAYPVDAELMALAEQSPRAFLSADPLVDAWGPPEDRPPMLYLDKCWSELQDVFTHAATGRCRPAHALVAGRVEHHQFGWTAHIKALDPMAVARIAADIVLVDESEVRTRYSEPGSNRYGDDPTEMIAYVLRYLSEARKFVTSLAEVGKGLVYSIG